MHAIIGTDVQAAASLLRAGELVGMPTETVYGLAGNALNTAAVANIFAVKERPAFDPLIMHLPDLESVAKYVTAVPETAIALAETYWPGPLTMVFKRKDCVPDLVTSGLDTVAVRIPNHPLALALLKELDFPLAAPSANPFGYVSPTRAAHVQKQLGHKIPYILDGGPCTIGLESSIISFAGPEPIMLRKGGLPLEEVESILGKPLAVNTHGSSNPQAPGMLAQHYSPGAAFELLKETDEQSLRQRIDAAPDDHAFMLFAAGALGNDKRVFDLSPKGDMAEAASQLFAIMRTLDEAHYTRILACLLPEAGLGRAINDRLRRAAAK